MAETLLSRARASLQRLLTIVTHDVAVLPPRVRAWLEYLLLLHRRLQEDRCFQAAGSLTFTTLLALVPLITIGVTVFSAFPAFGGFSSAIRQFAEGNLMPSFSGKVVTVYMQQFADNAGKLTAWGLVVLGASAVMTMLTIDGIFNTIWRVRHPRPLVNRILIYWAVLTIGPLLIGGSLSVTSWLLTRSMGLVGTTEATNLLLLKFVPLLLASAAMAFLYQTMPNRRVAFRDALVGGALAGVAFEAMKAAFGMYIRTVPTYKLVYGAFASLPIFLLWIYISWLVILIGAQVTAALPYLRTGGVRLNVRPGEQFLEAVRLLQQLYQAHRAGKVLKIEQLRVSLRVPFEDCERLLDQLAAAGWAAPTRGSGWVLARDASEIKLADVYQEFVFQADPRQSGDAPLEGLLAQLTRSAHDTLSTSLEALFSPHPEEAPKKPASVSRARAL